MFKKTRIISLIAAIVMIAAMCIFAKAAPPETTGFVADFVQETQGTKGWYYVYGNDVSALDSWATVTGYYNAADASADIVWYAAGIDWLCFRENGFILPGNDHDDPGILFNPAVKWLSDIEGTVDLTVSASAENASEFANGDGVTILVYKNSTKLGEIVMNGSDQTFTQDDVTIAAGDKIYTIADQGANNYYDSIFVDVEITKNPTAASSSDSSTSSTSSKPHTEPETTINFPDEFLEGIQGVGGWTYVYGSDMTKLGEWTPLETYLPDQYAWNTGGAVEWVFIRADGLMIPGSTAHTALKWVSDFNGTVDIDLNVLIDDACVADFHKGNGATMHIYKNNDKLGEILINAPVMDGTTQLPQNFFAEDVAVSNGDAIYIILDARSGNNAYDSIIVSVDFGLTGRNAAGNTSSETLSDSGTGSDPAGFVSEPDGEIPETGSRLPYIVFALLGISAMAVVAAQKRTVTNK